MGNHSPIITQNNDRKNLDKISLRTNLTRKKLVIYFQIFRPSIINLELKKDFEKLGYSSDEILIHLLKIFTTPLIYGFLTILSAIIMFNLSRDKSLLFHIIGILISVLIYYMNFIFNSLGNNGKIPISLSIFFQ